SSSLRRPRIFPHGVSGNSKFSIFASSSPPIYFRILFLLLSISVILICMAIHFLNREVSDLCLGKPALRTIPATTTIEEVLALLKRSSETHVSVWNCKHSSSTGKVLEAIADEKNIYFVVGSFRYIVRNVQWWSLLLRRRKWWDASGRLR
ncbi:hypothetical protein HAX54_035577, partial [Datura stramonium]|nr:hypothetical protein [Datura stramonium]